MDAAESISITVCGDGGCGKSSITLRLVRRAWTQEYDPTIEDSYSVTRTIDNRTILLSITDTAGQEEYRGLWTSSSLQSSDAFLLVYDITNEQSLEALDEFIPLVDIEADHRDSTGGVPPVKLIVGNKCDLETQRRVGAESAQHWAREHGCDFMETSARDMINIEEAFAHIIRAVMQARRDPQGYARNHINIYSPVRPADSEPFASSSSSQPGPSTNNANASSLRQKLKAKANTGKKLFRSPRVPPSQEYLQERYMADQQAQQDAHDQEQVYGRSQDDHASQQHLQDRYPEQYAREHNQHPQHSQHDDEGQAGTETGTGPPGPRNAAGSTSSAGYGSGYGTGSGTGYLSRDYFERREAEEAKRAKRSFWKRLKCW
ncbi:ras-domain-containing protein [Xylona heveae TC161]|uniref:Ras-domain-containing protein n=1 Tax=Xylona heveae (strain CBS 132557 / TC161) TaxID=1328760 RepID=A0A165I8F1_XYLHT|nr:ras-domain-containing protein [Xylona heveae TC161]KZF24534.1 ras-domain-containing protein [Xylona heveae TC161]